MPRLGRRWRYSIHREEFVECPSILFCLAGTTGDVAPALALADALRAAGMRVDVATHLEHRHAIEDLGLRYGFLPYGSEWLFESGLSSRLLRQGSLRAGCHALGLILLLREVQPALFQALCDLNVSAYDACLYTPLCAPLQYFADASGIPAIALHYQNAFPTAAHGTPYLSLPSTRSGLANRATFGAASLAADLFVTPRVVAAGRRYGLRLPRRRALLDEAWKRARLHIHAVSPWLTSGVPLSTFHEHRIGFLPPVLRGYGEAPDEIKRRPAWRARKLFVGIGSAPASHRLSNLISGLESYAARAHATLLVDQSIPTAVPRRGATLRVSRVRHDTLFSDVDVAVIAGGAGTIAAALRQGVPLIVLPHWFDHFIWRRLAQQKGLAARNTPSLGEWRRSIVEALDWALSTEPRNAVETAASALHRESAAQAATTLVVNLLQGRLPSRLDQPERDSRPTSHSGKRAIT